MFSLAIRSLSKRCFGLARSAIPNESSHRTVYTAEYFGIDKISGERATFLKKGDSAEAKTLVERRLELDCKIPGNEIEEQDLVFFMNLVKSDADFDALIKYHKIYVSKLHESQRTYSSTIMKLLHLEQRVDKALEYFRQEAAIFDNPISVVILLSLLFEHKRYDDVIETFMTYIHQSERLVFKENGKIDIATTKNFIGLLNAFTETALTINTPQVLEKAKSLFQMIDFESVIEAPNVQMCTRPMCRMAILAINQKDKEFAWKMIDALIEDSYKSQFFKKNLLVLFFCEFNQLDDAYEIFWSSLQEKTRSAHLLVCPDILQKLEESTKHSPTPWHQQELKSILEKVKRREIVLNKRTFKQLMLIDVSFSLISTHNN